MPCEARTAERFAELRDWLDDQLPALAAEHGVPGVAVGLVYDDVVVEATTGVLNRRTGVTVTADSVFQLGSVTKMWTATLAMQLVDEGLVDLDAPIRTYLPTFRVADEQSAARITTRHLLSHTAGFYGELEWSDSAAGDDAVRQYVDEVMPTLPQLFAPGRMFAYTNAGMVVLARLVEVFRDLPWARALRRHLTDPLGLEHVVTCADEAILYNAAVGHTDAQQPVPRWSDGCDAVLPVGGLAMSARDLLAFAQLHLRGGATPSGLRLLTEPTVRAMREPQVTHPRRFPYEIRQGLGWFLTDWPGGSVVEHSGTGIGQSAWLRLVPEQRLALVVLANVDSNANALERKITRHVLRELAGVKPPPGYELPSTPEPVPNSERYTGRYQDEVEHADVEVDDAGRLWLTWSRLDQPPWWVSKRYAEGWSEVPSDRYELVQLDGDIFACLGPSGDRIEDIAFVGTDAAGRAEFVHYASAVPRIA